MLLGVGSKVKLKHTGDRGEVTEILPEGMVNVYLYDVDMEIPVFEDDLISQEAALVEGRIKFPKNPPKPSPYPPQTDNAQTQYQILRSVGLQLAFEPVLNNEEITEYYNVWLINDLKYEFIISLILKFDGQTHSEKSLKIAPMSKTDCGTLPFDRLNDSPVFEMQKWRVSTQGTEGFAKNIVKIKPKTFFSKMKTAPFLNKPVHSFLVFPKKEKKAESGEDLRNYTKRNASVKIPRAGEDYGRFRMHDVEEFASFNPEIDLHIEKLTSDWSGMNNAQILRLQLAHFENFMYEAIRLGVPRVFLIHGLGKGKLRDSIATKLIKMREVKSFKNEYHPRYGWGATEVNF